MRADWILSPQAYPASWKTLAFEVPVNKTFWADPAAREHLVFAYSPNKPEKDPNSIIFVHQYAGYHTLDLNKDFTPASVAPPSHVAQPGKGTSDIANGQTPHKSVYQGSNTALKRYEKLIILHGFLVSLGFLVILPAGSLIGRYGRAFTPKWFHAHQVSNFYVALPVIVLGVLLGPAVVYSKESFRTHFMNGHEVWKFDTEFATEIADCYFVFRINRSTVQSSSPHTASKFSWADISTSGACSSRSSAPSRATTRR